MGSLSSLWSDSMLCLCEQVSRQQHNVYCAAEPGQLGLVAFSHIPAHHDSLQPGDRSLAILRVPVELQAIFVARECVCHYSLGGGVCGALPPCQCIQPLLLPRKLQVTAAGYTGWCGCPHWLFSEPAGQAIAMHDKPSSDCSHVAGLVATTPSGCCKLQITYTGIQTAVIISRQLIWLFYMLQSSVCSVRSAVTVDAKFSNSLHVYA